MADPIFSIYNTYISSGTADNTFDIGTAGVEFRHLYIDGTANIDQLQVDEGATFADNLSVTVGTGTGLKIGAATNQKLSIYGVTPVVQGVGTVDIRTALINFGLFASGGANPLNLNGGILTAGSATISTILTVGTVSASGTVIVADSVYGSDWNGSNAAPTRNAVFDKIEAFNLTSGTYTPALTNIANLSGSTAFSCQYSRVGGTVAVSGKVNIFPTLTVTATSLDISLPVASTFTSNNHCGGTAASPGIASQVMAMVANTASAVAQMRWVSADITSQDTYFSFVYRVV